MKTTSPRRLRRMLVWFSFGFASSVALLIGFILVGLDENVTLGVFASAVGLNLIASVLFALVFIVLTNWVQARDIMESITEGFSELTTLLDKNTAQAHRMFLPSKRYEALNPTSSYFGDAYNRDITLDLEESGTFAFDGPSARYVATRLLAAHHHPHQIRIAMISPANRRAISRRAADRRSWPSSRGMSIEQLEQELTDELLMNIVSLFECRRLCPIEILYYNHTAVYRHVLLDQAVYVSWYHSPQQMEMPDSYRFGKDSFTYVTFRMDLNRKFEMSTDKVVFDASHGDDVLIDHLHKLTGKPVTAADLDRWRTEQDREDVAAFSGFLDKIYEDLEQQRVGTKHG
jgi:hypothetical protein